MPSLYPLRFRPVLRQYLWGGRRLETSLGKPLPPGDDWAESWEIADLGSDQSVVETGPLAGTTLGELVSRFGRELLGRRHPQPRFPLLLKFLDAAQTLSVQVHPDDARAARLAPPRWGKTEAWVVLEAELGSVLYAGLKPGIDRDALSAAIRQGKCEECLHVLRPSPGDSIFLPAGTVHALGAGLLVAEIQQPSNVTYRLFDWNRLGPDGLPRPLHVAEALDAVDFTRGPIEPQRPQPTDRPEVSRLVECEKFVLDRWEFEQPLPAGAEKKGTGTFCRNGPEGASHKTYLSPFSPAGGDDRFHIISVLQGPVQIEGDPAGSPLPRGGTALLPAALGPVQISPHGRAVLLDAYLP